MLACDVGDIDASGQLADADFCIAAAQLDGRVHERLSGKVDNLDLQIICL